MDDPTRTRAVEIAPGALYGLCVPHRLDGRTTTYPGGIDGWAPMNCYVLVEDGHALLIDTGYTAHEALIAEQLRPILARCSSVAVLPLRPGEFSGVCNVRALAEQFPIGVLYGRAIGEPHEWLDFRSDLSDALGPGGALRSMTAEPLNTSTTVTLAPRSSRTLQMLPAPLRLLPWPWAYDSGTRTLFTTDVFTWGIRPGGDGPWTITADDDPTTADVVWDVMTERRYWWLPGARLERLRAGVTELFETHDVEHIAPGAGCVITGQEAVRRPVALLLELLDRASGSASIGLDVGSWPMAGGAR
jgi:hypothetical protein